MIRKLIRRAADRCRMVLGAASPVLVYHAAFSRTPTELAEGLHNVRPTVIREQLLELRRYFDFVTVDELAEARSSRGMAAITFDDGYLSVLEEAFPLLADLNIPATVFVCGRTLDGGTLWRDKARMILNLGLVGQFEAAARSTRRIGGMSFYRYTKEEPNNSRAVEAEIDAFLAARGVTPPKGGYCLSGPEQFIRHRLLSYGNHSQDHYNLASLSAEEQYEQLAATKTRLAAIPGIQVSSAVAVPFGQARHFNDDTVRVTAELGYRSLLLSRNRITDTCHARGGLSIVERFMPDERPMSVIFPQALGRKAA